MINSRSGMMNIILFKAHESEERIQMVGVPAYSLHCSTHPPLSHPSIVSPQLSLRP